MKNWSLLLGLALSLSAVCGEVLFDFESGDESWTVKEGHPNRVEVSPLYATSGNYSLLFTADRYDPPMPRWPGAYPLELPVKDWRGYEKLVFDLVNPTPDTERVGIILSDPEGGNFGGFFNHCGLFLQPYSHYRMVIHLPSLPAAIDRTRLWMQIFTEAPEHDYRLHLDNFQLLRTGEEPAPLPAAFADQIIALRRRLLAGVEEQLARAEHTLKGGRYTPEVKAVGEAAFAELSGKVLEARRRAADPALPLEVRSQAIADALGVAEQFARLEELLRWLEAGTPREGVLTGFVQPERRVFPRDRAIGVLPEPVGKIAAARNEREGVVLVAAPVLRGLEGVSVRLSPFVRDGEGEVLTGSVAPVGFVRIKNPGVLDTPYLGWWPDPVLPYLETLDIGRFDYQSWHIAVDIPEEQPAGLYRATLTLSAAGLEPIELPLELTVRDFAIPKHAPLALAFATTYPRNTGPGVDWTRILTADTPEDRAGRQAFDDFLMKYNLTLDHLYRDAPPVYAEQERERELGKLVQALAYTFYGPVPLEQQEAFIDSLVAAVRPVYAELERRGLLEYAYLYGFDEIPGAEEQLGALTERLHAEFPGLPVMTTAIDPTYGNASAARAVDIWVPTTQEYDPGKAVAARARGKQVWYYVCMGPTLPYANFMLDNDLTGMRQLPGFLAAASRTDGLLYYETTMWRDNPGLENGPFLEQWQSATSTAMHHADGSLFYPGPDGLPLPSLRLEAFRNGLDDYACYAILKAQYQRLKDDPARAGWSHRAGDALAALPQIAASLSEYSQSPEKVGAYREALDGLIEEAGVAVNPWGDDFSIRSGAVLNLPEMQ